MKWPLSSLIISSYQYKIDGMLMRARSCLDSVASTLFHFIYLVLASVLIISVNSKREA